MIALPNGCRRSEFNIVPKNWNSAKAKLTDTWYIECRFIDPNHQIRFPKGRIIRVKAGINKIKNLTQRRAAIKFLRDEHKKFFDEGFNPITDKEIKVPEPKISGPITQVLPSTPFIDAFRFALSMSTNTRETKKDTGSVLNSVEAAAEVLGFLTIPIEDIQVKHIKLCLDQCRVNSTKFSAHRFNQAKTYLSGLYNYLTEVGAAHGNMAKAIRPMKEIPSKPVVLKDSEITLVKKHLLETNKPFYNFMMIFFYSGGRISELMRLQGKDVDLKEQVYTSNVLKGGSVWKDRTIRNIALPYWKKQLKKCGPDDYVFTVNFAPGKKPINPKQVTRKWREQVMKPLGVKATFYKLKHLSADRTVEAVGAKIAAGQMGHTTTKMAEDVYAKGEKKRIHETLKDLDIKL